MDDINCSMSVKKLGNLLQSPGEGIRTHVMHASHIAALTGPTTVNILILD